MSRSAPYLVQQLNLLKNPERDGDTESKRTRTRSISRGNSDSNVSSGVSSPGDTKSPSNKSRPLIHKSATSSEDGTSERESPKIPSLPLAEIQVMAFHSGGSHSIGERAD